MAELPLEEAIPRFKQNEDRVDQFVNGAANATWQPSSGAPAPTLRKLIADIGAEGDGILAQARAAADAAEAAAANFSVPALAALRALVPVAGQTALFTDELRQGRFVFRAGNYSSQVALDTLGGIYVKADFIPATAGAWVRMPDGSGRYPIEAFGAVFDDVTDSTAAVQAAFRMDVPLMDRGGGPNMQLVVKDTILVEHGVDYLGAGGVVLNTAARSNWDFSPPTKRNLFQWRLPPTLPGYVFEGANIRGFAVRGTGPGGTAVFEMPGMYQGELSVDAYVGFDYYAVNDCYLNTKFGGSITAPRVSGFHWKNTVGTGASVTTTCIVDTYISQGSVPAHRMDVFAVFGVVFRGIVESMPTLYVAERGNFFVWETYSENVPNVNSGSAMNLGLTGTPPVGISTGVIVRSPSMDGRNAATAADWANTTFANIDHCDFFFLDGCSMKRYGAMFATTTNSKSITVSDVKTLGIGRFDAVASPINRSAFTFLNFSPVDMQFGSDSFFATMNLAAADLELHSQPRSTITRRKLFSDEALSGKIVRRDDFGNFTSPIGMLQTSALSGWTFGGGRLVPGELVSHEQSGLGLPAVWRSQRHTKDTGISYGLSTTVAGSPIVTRTSSFFPTEVGDWVTVSTGFPSATAQYRVLARAADWSTLTLDTAATGSSTTATVATESHQLVPVGQQGARSCATTPVGAVTPFFLGEEVFVTGTAHWFKSTGLTTADWKQMT